MVAVETTTLTLAEFLLARIAEDEEQSEFAQRAADERKDPDPVTGWRSTLDGGYVHEPPIVGVDPDRALAECEAKRRIVDTVQRMVLDADDPAVGMSMKERFMTGSVARNLLSSLALPYADHPDFREEWRP